MKNFKNSFENLGYTFQSATVLEDVYLFSRYYKSEVNQGVAAILLEGDPGSGKTYLSKVFSKFLGQGTEYIYTQCVEETNSDKLIATINVPAIFKGEKDKTIAEGILTKAINLANLGKTVVLAIDELDKAREVLDSYFLDFLQSGKIETSENEILSLTEEGRKRLFVIFAKNNERNLLDALLRRCSVIELPPMPPVLAYKTLVKNFNATAHDSKFLKFVCKVYEAIYNEQMNSSEKVLSRLPSLQELTLAISSDYELFENGISSTRRINNLIRKIGKDNESRKVITNILIKYFKYKNQESNYTDETLNLDFYSSDDYMSNRDVKSLVEQYIEKKDNGEPTFDEDDVDDPMKSIASILENMANDQSLVFLSKENKKKIVEIGTITHKDPKALNILFDKIKFKGNPNSRFGFLNFEDDNFIGLMKYKNSLVLIANKEYVSPRLLIRGLSTIITIINDYNENIDMHELFFSDIGSEDFKLTGLNVKVLSNIPDFVLNKMAMQNGDHTFQTPNFKVTYDDSLNTSYFRYMQKYRAEPIYEAIEKMCSFNPELALPASFINARKFNRQDISNRNIFRPYSDFEVAKEDWEDLKEEGWKVIIDDFQPVDFSSLEKGSNKNERKSMSVEDDFVFNWETDVDNKNKKLHVYPKYMLNGNYYLYTSDLAFENDELIERLNPFQKEIALMARSIFGNFVPINNGDCGNEFFSLLTMSFTGRLVDDKNIGYRIPRTTHNITTEKDFENYFDLLSQPSAIIPSEKQLKRR